MASIERNAQSQARVVEDLIELSRVVTGKLQLRRKPMDLRAVVEAALDVVRTAAAGEGRDARSRSCRSSPADRLGRPRSACSRSSGTCCRTPSSSPSPAARSPSSCRRRAQLLDRGRRHSGIGISPGISAVHLRALPPGRSVDDTRARRPRAGAGDRQGNHRAAWRRAESDERRPRRRQPLHADASATADD